MKKTVRIKDRTYPCRLTMGAMLRFKRESGRDVSLLDTTDIGDLILFLFCAVQSACSADEVEFPFSLESFADNLAPDDITAFYTAMETGSDESQKKTMATVMP